MIRKGLISVVVLCLFSAAAWAQSVPAKVNYQGRLFDSAGFPVDGVSLPMSFSLWDADTGGTELWSEGRAVQVEGGLYNVILGDSVSIPPTVFSGATVFLEVTAGGEVMSPRQMITSVPYAMRALSVPGGPGSGLDADLLDGMDSTAFALVSHTHDASEIVSGVVDVNLYSAYQDLSDEGYLNDDAAEDLPTRLQADGRFVNVVGDEAMAGSLTVGGDLEVTGGNIGLGIAPTASYGIVNDETSPPSFGAKLTGGVYGLWAQNSTDPTHNLVYLSSSSYGIYATSGTSTTPGDNSGGRFFGHSQDGTVYGVLGYAYAYGGNPSYGIRGFGSSPGSGDAYGGYFSTLSSGGGTHYGVFAEADDYAGWFEDGVVHVGAAGYEDYVSGDGDLYVASTLEVDGVAYLTGGLEAPLAIDPSDVNFNYAAGVTKGGPAADLECADCVSAAEVQFNWAMGNSEGGAALDLSCTNCVSAAEVQFNYAAGDSEGGAALDLSCTNCVNQDQVEDIYVLNTTDSMSGDLTVGEDLRVDGTIAIGTGPTTSAAIINDQATAPYYGAYIYGSTYGLRASWATNPNYSYAYLAAQDNAVFGRAGVSGDTSNRYGGRFYTYTQGMATALHGYAGGYGSVETRGLYSAAYNTSTGDVFAGKFSAEDGGSGNQYGVHASALANASGEKAYGVYGSGANSSTGEAFGGYFKGDGDASYGVYAEADEYPIYAAQSGDTDHYYAYLASSNYGIYARVGTSAASNVKCGGAFYSYSDSISYGAFMLGESDSNVAYGAYGYARQNGASNAYGGYFANASDGTGTRIGVYAGSNGNAWSGNYALYAGATGATAGQNYGLYSYVSNATDYALYAPNGQKSWVNPDPEDPAKSIVYVTLEGGISGTYHAGRARLSGGRVTVVLPDHFRKVTSPEENVMVTVTPRGRCNGLFVSESDNASFTVEELAGGESNVEFDFIVMGYRLGYEDYEPIRENLDYVPFQGNLEGMDETETTTQEFYDDMSEGVKKIFIKNGTLDEKGKVNEKTFQQKGWKNVKVKKEKADLNGEPSHLKGR